MSRDGGHPFLAEVVVLHDEGRHQAVQGTQTAGHREEALRDHGRSHAGGVLGGHQANRDHVEDDHLHDKADHASGRLEEVSSGSHGPGHLCAHGLGRRVQGHRIVSGRERHGGYAG